MTQSLGTWASGMKTSARLSKEFGSLNHKLKASSVPLKWIGSNSIHLARITSLKDELHFIPTEYQLVDIFTKPLDEPTFTRLKAELGMFLGAIIYNDLVTKLLNKSRLKYVSYPSKVTDIELTAHMIVVNNQKDSVSLLPLATKPKKGKSQTVTQTLPKSQGSEVPGALFLRNIQLASMGLPSTLDEGTRKSQPLPESTATPPKDSGGNIQPFDMDLTSTTSDEGTAKTTPRPKGSLRDKDSGGNIPPVDMEPIHLTIVDISGTGKPSYEEELDTQPLVLSTYADVRAFLLSDDEAQESEKDILGADKPQSSHAPSIEASDTNSFSDNILKKYENILPITEQILVKYIRKISNAMFAKITEDNWEKHGEAAVNYADLKASIDDYYDENISHRDQTDKLVEAFMSSLDKSSNTISDLYKGLYIITELLKEIKNVVKDDSVIKKISEATESFTKFSTNIIDLQASMNTLQAHALKQDEELSA
ncbi:hypothetical protein Tco_0591294 [Tanacetum coccineum]